MNLFQTIYRTVIIYSITCVAWKPAKLCVNCQYFLLTQGTDAKYGKCFLFPKAEENLNKFLVTGSNINDEYYLCTSARQNIDMCGKEGKSYRKTYTFKREKFEENNYDY